LATTSSEELERELNNNKINSTIINLFIAISLPIRHNLRNYFTGQLQFLVITKKLLLSKVNKFDIIYNKLNALNGVLVQALIPIDRIYKSFPVDKVLLQDPEISKIFNDIIKFVFINIPSTITGFNIDPVDVADGINSYEDLRDKIEDLNYKMARNLSIKENLINQTKFIDDLIDRLQGYIDLIELLDTYGL
jgi:hypothetical protein